MILQALTDKQLQELLCLKIAIDFFWTIFQNNSFAFQNGVAMEALDTATARNSRWKMLVTDIFTAFVDPLHL
jgi:hypothetical protein